MHQRPKILVMAHDAGGGELLAEMIAAELGLCRWLVAAPQASPARRAFERRGLCDLLLDGEADEMEGVVGRLQWDLVIYNPGWNRFPGEAAAALKGRGVTTAALLDHWIDYRERFAYPRPGWERLLPDYTLVCDARAMDLALSCHLPEVTPLRNYHLLAQRQRFDILSADRNAEGDDLLFISQTVSNPAAKRGFTYLGDLERQAMAELASWLEGPGRPAGLTGLRVRLHPAERLPPPAHLPLGNLEYKLERAADKDLLESISEAALVIGLNSMALYTAFMMGKPALSLIPGGHTPCSLPLPRRCRLSTLEGLKGLPAPCIADEVPDLFAEHTLAGLLAGLKLGAVP